MKNKGLTAESGFVAQVKRYGIWKLIFSWDFGVALLAFVLILLNRRFGWHILSSFSESTLGFIVTVAAAIFSVLITALAIILSFSSSNFVKFLREKNMFDEIIFIFWWTSIAFLTVLGLTFLKSLLIFKVPGWAQGLGSALILSMFLYALIETYYVIGALMRFAYFLGFYESKATDK